MKIGVLNTRPREQAAELNRLLERAGYAPREVPLVELVLFQSGWSALGKISETLYDGILLSSPNLLLLLESMGEAVPEAWLRKPWYLIGAKARPAVEALGASVAFVPETSSLEGFLKEVPAQSGLRLIHPCSAKTRLEPGLFLPKGIRVHNFAVYEPQCPLGTPAALEAAWPQVRAVLFASGSAVHNLFDASSRLGRTLGTAGGPFALSIGASSTRALRAHGVHDVRQASTAEIEGFIPLLDAAFPEKPPA